MPEPALQLGRILAQQHAALAVRRQGVVVGAAVDAAQRVLAWQAVEHISQLVQVVGVGAHALQRLHARCGEGAVLDRGTSARAQGRGCAWEGVVRALFFDGGGDLGDGVGDHVEGVLRESVRECEFQRVQRGRLTMWMRTMG